MLTLPLMAIDFRHTLSLSPLIFAMPAFMPLLLPRSIRCCQMVFAFFAISFDAMMLCHAAADPLLRHCRYAAAAVEPFSDIAAAVCFSLLLSSAIFFHTLMILLSDYAMIIAAILPADYYLLLHFRCC